MSRINATTSQGDLMQTLANSMTPRFAVAYIRVSTAEQAKRGGGDDEGYSIPAQRDGIHKKAGSLGAMVGKEFVDRGVTGTKADRKELQNMLEYIRENKDRIDYVIVHKLDRLARNMFDNASITRTLQEANIQLVSVSEGIDYTPAGMLLNGVLSSVAEFYSRNLSTEVTKGIVKKVERGGTPTKSPLGYINIREYDKEGQRNSRVEVDSERAPLITLAFTEYATGKWSLSTLAEHLVELGLATPKTKKLPSKPIGKKMLHAILRNPYYKGIVTYRQVQYPGKHTPLIDVKTWDKVQEILKSHINGERTRIHEHYLKSTVYCGRCGARLIIHNAKSRSGDRYPYFICVARHNKSNDCKQRAVLIDEVADKIEGLYERISFTGEFRDLVQQWLYSQIDELAKQSETEQNRLKLQKDKLQREQRKLLQAHYADAIPLHLMKEEQERINRSLSAIESQIKVYQGEYNEAVKNLDGVFELLEDCGRMYKLAGDYERRCFNQAIFKKILVHDDLTIEAEYAEPFDIILDSRVCMLKSEFEKHNTEETAGQRNAAVQYTLLEYINTIKSKTSRKISDFFAAGLSKDSMVRETGVEPARPKAYAPKAYVYTNFTTRARRQGRGPF